jgi:hypothetical protein
MGRANFSKATINLVSATSSNDDEAFGTVLRLERIILDHTPASPGEAVAMLDVIIPELMAGGRSDGRDILALDRIRTMLGAL